MYRFYYECMKCCMIVTSFSLILLTSPYFGLREKSLLPIFNLHGVSDLITTSNLGLSFLLIEKCSKLFGIVCQYCLYISINKSDKTECTWSKNMVDCRSENKFVVVPPREFFKRIQRLCI